MSRQLQARSKTHQSKGNRPPASGVKTHPVLKLQKKHGNRAVEAMLQPYLSRKAAAGGAPPGPGVTPKVASNINAIRGGGQPLSPTARRFFEPRLKTDLSSVRIHAGGRAADTARGVNARAFATGRDVVFGAGQYSPETDSGKRLLAHELIHVVQQTGAEAIQRDNSILPTLVAGRIRLSIRDSGVLQKSPKEDWDFTPVDYATLTKRGKNLEIAADSSWFPKELQTNLLNTLKYTLV